MKKLFLALTVVFFVLCAISPGRALAGCTNPSGIEGQTIYNNNQNVPEVCTGSQWIALGVLNPSAGGSGCTNPTGTEGIIIYNANVHIPQYCDGDNWIAMIGQVSGSSACTEIGDVCADGTVFIGNSLLDGQPFYTTRCDVGQTFNGLKCTGTPQGTDFTPDGDMQTWDDGSNAGVGTPFGQGSDEFDGHFNTAGMMFISAGTNTGEHKAAKACHDLVAHGYDDWYLPADEEMQLMFDAYTVIGGLARVGYQNGFYWSSNDYNGLNASIWSFKESNGVTPGNYPK